MIAFVKANVLPGSRVYTDGLKGFEALQAAGVRHVRRPQPRQGALLKGAPSVVPLADRVIGNLQQWLIGELSAWTFCTFPREFSSLRRPGSLSGAKLILGRFCPSTRAHVRSPVSPAFVSRPPGRRVPMVGSVSCR